MAGGSEQAPSGRRFVKAKGNTPRALAGKAAIESEKRLEDVLNLKLLGYTNAAIGRALGISGEGARKCVIRALDRLRDSNLLSAERIRTMELARLDRIQSTLANMIIKPGNAAPDLGAIDRLTRLNQQRLLILGLIGKQEGPPPTDPRILAQQVRGFLEATENPWDDEEGA